MHRPACVQCSADSPPAPFRAFTSPSPATRGRERGKGTRAGRREEKACMQGYKSLFPHVTSCHSARRRRAVDKHVLARTVRPSQPRLCLLPAPVLSARQSIRPFIHLSRTPKVLAQAQSSDQTHHSWQRLSTLGHSTHPRFQRARTPIPECMHVHVSCPMFLSPISLRSQRTHSFLSSLMSHHHGTPQYWTFPRSEILISTVVSFASTNSEELLIVLLLLVYWHIAFVSHVLTPVPPPQSHHDYWAPGLHQQRRHAGVSFRSCYQILLLLPCRLQMPMPGGKTKESTNSSGYST